MHKKFIQFVRDTYQTSDFVPLHQPTFNGKEKDYVADTIDSTFVSSVGEYVNKFELDIAKFTGSPRAVATVNGTAALHVALHAAGVGHDDMVITQALTFVATCNAVLMLGAEPVFVDVEKRSLGMCPESLSSFLEEFAYVDDSGRCVHKVSGKLIKAVVPMHTFGHPVKLDEILAISERWKLVLVEDAAESLGSYYKGVHTGGHGHMSAVSFNGNKIITTGGGGMVLCRDIETGEKVKHLTTTAKVPHAYEFYHDEQGFNYRMPNLNAALGCAQLESLKGFLLKKRELAYSYKSLFSESEYLFVEEPSYALSNYWLNAVICETKEVRDDFLESTNKEGVMTRPVWQLMHRLPIGKSCYRSELPNSEWAESLLVNIPSTPC